MSSWTLFGLSMRKIGKDQSSKRIPDPNGFQGLFGFAPQDSTEPSLYKLLWLFGHLESPEKFVGGLRSYSTMVSLTPSKIIPVIFPEFWKKGEYDWKL